jgi:hypothetical protein
MKRYTTPGVSVTARPILLDYLLVLLGCGLSLLLLPLLPFEAAAEPERCPEQVRPLVEKVPAAMRLVEGVVLLWPVFLFVQALRGRSEAPTAAEWLWILSWLGVAAVTLLAVWSERASDSMPAQLGDFLAQYAIRRLWYILLVPSIGLIALVLVLHLAIRRTTPPWTHTFALALVIWPALLMGALFGLANLGLGY